MAKYMTFVFDDGPCSPMREIVDKMKEYGYKAGFAIVGRQVNRDTADMLKYAVDNGFQLVSHGQEHLHVEKLGTREEMIYEMTEPIKAIKRLIGYDITMARLPFLSANDEVYDVMRQLSLPLLGQGIDGGRDWSSEALVPDIVKAVLTSAEDGAVGCLHVRTNTCRALDTVLPELKRQGYILVTPEELLRIAGITPPLGVQIHNVNDFLR